MVTIELDGSTTVKELRKQFKEALGLSLRVYAGKTAGKGAVKAEDKQKLEELGEGKKIKKETSFIIHPGMTSGEFEQQFHEAFDILVQVADAPNKKLMSNEVTLLAPAEMESGGLY
jgi:hypothetical protein